MGQVAEAWLECQKRIDDYVDEQVAMRTKEHFLKEDWEVFKQRRFIEQLPCRLLPILQASHAVLKNVHSVQ